MNRSSKLNEFQKELKLKILEHELNTNKEVYLYTISNAFLSKHGRQVVKTYIK